MGEPRLPGTVMVEIVGEPFLSRAQEYRRQFGETVRAWRAFGKELGATGVPSSLTGLNFEGRDHRPPSGWTVPSRQTGYSHPKKGHPDEERIKAMPKMACSREVFGDAIITDITYQSEGCQGSRGIGYFGDGPSIGWLGSGKRMFARIPHGGNAAANTLAQYPGCTIKQSNAVGWVVPAGLIEISDAEYKLIEAQDEVDRERARSALAQATTPPEGVAQSGEGRS